MHDSRLPSPDRVKFIESPRLKNDDTSSNVERALRLHALSKITIQVGACECDDQWEVRVSPVEPIDRLEAAPGVKRNKEVDLFAAVTLKYDRPMPNLFKNLCPAKGCDLIAGTGLGPYGCDDADFHIEGDSRKRVPGFKVIQTAQVRKPAQMSRRSGV